MRDCFAASTLVKTARGRLPIYLVNIGDYVYTHRNRVREVIGKTISYDKVGKLIIGKEVIYATENQLFFISSYNNSIEALKDLPKQFFGLSPHGKKSIIYQKVLIKKSNYFYDDFIYSLEVEEDQSFLISKKDVSVFVKGT